MIRAYFAREEHLLPDDERNRRMIVAGIHEHLSDIPDTVVIAPEWLLCNAVRGLLSLEEYDARSMADIEADGILRALDRAEPAAVAKIRRLIPPGRLKAGFADLRALVRHHSARQPQRGRDVLDLLDRTKIFANELHIVSLREWMERRRLKAAVAKPVALPNAKKAAKLSAADFELDLLPDVGFGRQDNA